MKLNKTFFFFRLLISGDTYRSQQWMEGRAVVKELATCLQKYAEHLDAQLTVTAKNQALKRPVRTIDKDADIEHRYATSSVRPEYEKLQKAVLEAGVNKPVVFDEEEHVDKPFQSSQQRIRFIENLHLSVPVYMIRFCPGGSQITTLVFVRIESENENLNKMLTDGDRYLQMAKLHLKEYHTRAMRKEWKSLI